MLKIIKTIFQNGVFVLQEPVDFPEGAEVDIFILKQPIIGENISDNERKKILAELIQEMRQRNLSSEAPEKITRENLHERS